MIPARLSYTRINALSCPAMYQAYYLRGVPETSSAEADDGKHLHKVQAECCRRLSRANMRRGSDLCTGVFNEHGRLLSDKKYYALQEIHFNWMNMFSLDSSAKLVRPEYEMAVTRDFQAIDISKAILPNGLARIDCFTGIADLLQLLNNVITALVHDWKDGNQMYDMFEAQKSRQLQGYSYLAFKNFPELERILAHLLAPKFRQLSTADFKRELLIPEFEKYLAGEWLKVDRLREERGERDWPAEVNYDKACKWCRDSKDFKCPEKEALCGRRKAA